MGEFLTDAQKKRAIVRDVMDTVMSGAGGSIARHFAPGAVFSNKSNAGIIDAPWFDRMEGEYRLHGEEEAKSFINALMKRATYISYKTRGTVIEGEEAASRCDWTRRDETNGSLVTGTTMYWFEFTSDGRIRTIETIGSVHSVIPAPRRSENGSHAAAL